MISSDVKIGVAVIVGAFILVFVCYGIVMQVLSRNHSDKNVVVQQLLPVKNIAPAPKTKPPAKKETEWTEWKLFAATAYTNRDEGCNDTTATGLELVPISRVVAVDPRVIPLHSHVEIRGLGVFYAEDKGQAINGSMVDIFMWASCDDDVQTALQFGLRRVQLRWKPPDSSD